MAADCGSCCAKYILCIFNFIFFLAGSALLGVGIWLAADKASFISLLKMVENEHVQSFTHPQVIEQMAYVLIVCGAVMFVLSFLGYCGAIRESRCLLTTYAVFMIVLLLVEISLGTITVVYKQRSGDETRKFLNSTIEKYYTNTENPDAVTVMWNHLMRQMTCCGVTDFQDFDNSKKWLENRGDKLLPDACCILGDEPNFTLLDPECPKKPSDSNSYRHKGCYHVLRDWIDLNRNIILGSVIGIAIIQLFAIFLAFCLCKSIEKYRGMRL